MSRRSRRRQKKQTQQIASAVTASPTMGDVAATRIFERLQAIGAIPESTNDANGVSIPFAVRSLVADDKKQSEENYRRALDNQRYYLRQAASLKRPWFQCPKLDYQYSEMVLVNPAMAVEGLGYNPDNRNKSEQTFNAYGRDMANNRWLQTAESIDVDVNGNFYNGQHRLEAVVFADSDVPLYVTWNVPVTARLVVDSGKKRTVNEKLSMVCNAKLGNRKAAICRAMMSGVASRIKYSESEIAEFAIKHEEILQWIAANLRNARADLQAAIGKSVLWYGSETMTPFCTRFTELMFESTSDPVALLCKWLINCQRQGIRLSGDQVYRKTVSAIEHYINHRSIERLYERDVDIFEWNPGWEVPDDAPAKNIGLALATASLATAVDAAV